MTDVLLNLVREKKNKLFMETQKHFIFHREQASPAKHLSSVLLCLSFDGACGGYTFNNKNT